MAVFEKPKKALKTPKNPFKIRDLIKLSHENLILSKKWKTTTVPINKRLATKTLLGANLIPEEPSLKNTDSPFDPYPVLPWFPLFIILFILEN